MARVVEAVGPAAAELPVAHAEDAAQHRRDAAAGPSNRVLDLGERARTAGCCRESVEQLAHQVAAAVVETGDLGWIAHDIPDSVLLDVTIVAARRRRYRRARCERRCRRCDLSRPSLGEGWRGCVPPLCTCHPYRCSGRA